MKRVLFFGTLIALLFVNGFSVYSQKRNADISDLNFINGQIISSDDATISGKLSVSGTPYDENIVGVFVKEDFVQKPNGEPTLIPKPAIKNEGIVKVKYNSQNGTIHKGDWLTSSSQLGEAMKSIDTGMVLGIALEDAKESSGIIRIRILIQYITK